jgi:hypothetical protein
MNTLRSSTPVRATVCADGIRADYLRAGTGRPVVVLVPPDGDERGVLAFAGGWPLVAELLAARAAGRCHLIVPVAPPEATGLADWLAAFADGLGVAGLALVVAEPLGAAARAFAVRESDLVSRLVVVRRLPADLPPAGPAVERVERIGIPLLVLTLSPDDAETADGRETLVGFLADFPGD